MKISELIEKLSAIQKEHGDLECMSQDGTLLSDFEPVRELRIDKDDGEWHDNFGAQIVKIEST